MLNFIERHFIFVIIILSSVALLIPNILTELKPFIPVLLSIIMFGIGFTLKADELKNSWSSRWSIIMVILFKYSTIPAVAYLIGKTLNLPLVDLIGIVIISACPGGTAANVMSYLSRSNVTLTIILTLGTTIISPLVSPMIIYLLLHKYISIPFLGMVKNMLTIILLPIIVGVLFKKIFSKKLAVMTKVFPVISIFAIALVIACVIALTQHQIFAFPKYVIISVTALNIFSYFIGMLISKLSNLNKTDQKSVIFEYGMFDTGLAVVIATSFFGPLAALPGALLSIIQNITASVLVRKYVKMNQINAVTTPDRLK
jgi:bile acid:Na+ symporter, BASS family